MKYYFLKEDFEELEIKAAEIRERILFYQKEKGLSTTQSSETWHDNYGYEESERQIKRLYGQLEEFMEIKMNAEIVEPAKRNNKVDIGKMVKIKNLEIDEEKEVLIGSYMVLKNKNAVSYESPLGKILFGAKKGKIKKGVIKNVKISFKVIEIN